MNEIIFLGTGGGRYTTLFQERSTGGIILKIDSHQIHIDPGPGALLRCKECGIYPFQTDLVLATHHHLDHINDLNVIIEGMTHATKRKRGTLITTNEVVSQALTLYHNNLIEKIITLTPRQSTIFEGIRIEAVKCVHSAKDSIGFKFYTKDYCIYYTGDTFVYPGFENNLLDVDYLIANNILPSNNRVDYHMCTNDLINAVNSVSNKIKLIMITHFDLKILKADPDNEAKLINEKTKINCIAAKDSMTINLEVKVLKTRE